MKSLLGRISGLAAVAAASVIGCSPAPSTERDVSLGELGAEPIRATPVVVSTDDWSFAGRKGWVIRTPHYRIYTTERDDRMRERMAVFVEYAIAHYRSAFTRLGPPASKLDVYLMDNRPQWERLTQRLMGQSAKDLSNLERGGYASRGIGVYYDLGLSDTFSIAAHEGWHQYTQRVFRDPLPVWLEEGIATYMEGHRWALDRPEFLSWANTERFDRLRESVGAGRTIPLDRLLEMKPQDQLGEGGDGLLDFYAHVWALTHFLREGEGGRYRTELDRLLREAERGEMRQTLGARLGRERARGVLARRVGNGVFRAYFGEDVGVIATEFDGFVRELVETGSREAIARGVSPILP